MFVPRKVSNSHHQWYFGKPQDTCESFEPSSKVRNRLHHSLKIPEFPRVGDQAWYLKGAADAAARFAARNADPISKRGPSLKSVSLSLISLVWKPRNAYASLSKEEGEDPLSRETQFARDALGLELARVREDALAARAALCARHCEHTRRPHDSYFVLVLSKKNSREEYLFKSLEERFQTHLGFGNDGSSYGRTRGVEHTFPAAFQKHSRYSTPRAQTPVTALSKHTERKNCLKSMNIRF